MFTALSERLTAALKRLTGRGVLSEQDVTEALREIRRHLLEADVSFEVRADPSVLTGSRRLRIAKGAGRTVQEVNRLLEQFQQMRKLLKRT